MTAPIPTDIPLSLTAGATWRWDRTLELYPPSEGWALRYRFIGDTAAFTVDAVVNGSVYEVTQAPDVTTGRQAAVMQVTELVERSSGTERHVVRQLTVTLKPNPLTLAPGSQRTQPETRLAVVRAAIDALVAGKTKSYSALGRTFEYYDLSELRALEKSFAATVRRQRTGRLDTPVAFVFPSVGPACEADV